MKPTHYHTGVSGRIRFVTLEVSKGTKWTSDGYNASTTDLRPVSRLIGKTVSYGSSIGRINAVSGEDRSTPVDGKYLGQGQYQKNNLVHKNQFVGVFWTTGVHPYWVPVHILKIEK